MLSKLELNGMWKAHAIDGQHGLGERYRAADCDMTTFIDAQVPGELHLDLERVGWIEDCNVGVNAQNARWVEEQIWVMRRVFVAPSEALKSYAYLVFDGLDLNAKIFLNGEEVGSHDNAFVPCRVDVTGKLIDGENLLAVEIESGLYGVADKPIAPYHFMPDVQLHKRSWQRKPQYTFSWDWNPRLINVGITKSVRLEYTQHARIDSVTVYPELANDHKSAKIHANVFLENPSTESVMARVKIIVSDPALSSEIIVELPAGSSKQSLCVQIDNPKLWWPRPHGDQPMYDVSFEVEIDGVMVDSAKRRTGIRSVRLDQSPHPEAGNYFIIEINGKPIFAKGGNWVPPDMIYARPDADHYRKLVDLAVDANFNALRIWGGGLYADHAFLDACDEKGVIVWHDFLFACSLYPFDDPSFADNVKREVTFGVRDLSAHPSLVVWSGNNELEWGYWDWGMPGQNSYSDYALYHLVMPRTMAEEDPSRPYWPSSPYSNDHTYPNDPTTGDQHPWHVTLGPSETNYWAYRDDVSRFANEGGVLGATSPATLRQFLPEDDRKLKSRTWEFHENACNYWTKGGIAYEYVENWLGLIPKDMNFEDYVFYSAILQSEGLQEYSNNYRRRMFSSSSAIFWMYNDSWPASHGWTIVDYYLRKKLAYHPVRRSFEPIYVIPAIEGENVVVYGVNDSLTDWQGEVRYGVFNLAGSLPVDERLPVTLTANASTVLGQVSIAKLKEMGTNANAVFAMLYQDGEVKAQNRIFLEKFKDLKFAKPEISVRRDGAKAVFNSPTFVWAVCLDIDGEAPVADDIFDVLPGIDYSMDWPEDKPLPTPQRCGSPLG